jgi:hypothetical protein
LPDELKNGPNCMGGYYPSIYEYTELNNLDSVLKKYNVKSQVNFQLIELVKEFVNSQIKLFTEKEKEDRQQVDLQLFNLDTDKNGVVDRLEIIEDFKKIISKYQKEIIDIDKNYIHKFIKVSKYLDDKKENIQVLFNTVKDCNLTIDKADFLGVLNNQIHLYELTSIHSLSMIISLINNDLITFYEIYETFDKLNIFNSNWENEVSQKLTDIDNNLGELIYSIQDMEIKISKEIKNLTYMTELSFDNLNKSINNELNSINSSIKFNNLLQGIQTYQMYKINKNTKGLS